MLNRSKDTPQNTPTFHRFHAIIVLVALLGVLALQLPWISRPPFDAHAFRQSQTLATIELFALEGIDLMHPKTNYVGEPGFFVLELPLFQAFCALLYQWFGPHAWMIRVLNLLFTLGNAALTFAIGKRLFNPMVGFAAMLLYLFAPLNLLYMTSVLIDPSATCCSLMAFLLALRILHPKEDEGPAGFVTWAVFAVACTVTALIKTLYLFPTCVLLAGTFLKRRKLSASLLAAGLCLVVAAGLFAIWLRHSRNVNDASYFTRNVNPTTLLGFEPLVSPLFYENMARRFSWHIAGPGGVLLAILGIITGLRKHNALRSFDQSAVAILLFTIVGYYAVFSKANAPHDYYSLVMSPYVCLAAGLGVLELARRAAAKRSGWLALLDNPVAIVAAAVFLSLIVFFKPAVTVKQPRLAPAPMMKELQALSQGMFDRWSFGIVFAAPDPRFPPPDVALEAPQILYATGLRGTGYVVPNAELALSIWKDKRPHYKHLKYAVFYGVNPPQEIVQATQSVIVSDPAHKWFAYRVD